MEESHLKQKVNFGHNKYFSGRWKDKIFFLAYSKPIFMNCDQELTAYFLQESGIIRWTDSLCEQATMSPLLLRSL